jgi:tetratricopeptide (TPR) repeat protein
VQAFAREAQAAHPELVVVGGNGVAYTGLGDPYHPFREVLRQLSGEAEARWRAGAMTAEHALRLWNTLPLTVQALVSDGPDLVNTFVGGKGLVERARACGPAEAGWLGELEELVERKAASPAAAGPMQSALFGQYTRVVQSVARQAPILLILDDLQWADVGSISLLFHMGREMAGSRMLVVGVYRPEEVALGRGGERHPLEPVVNELRRDLGEMTVDLGRAAGREFVEALLDSEPNRLGTEFRETLYRQTQGHPLFTVELLRGMEERGDLVRDGEGRWVEDEVLDWETLPARVEAVIAERVGRLVGGLQETLAVASVEGEEFTAEVVAQVADEPNTARWLSNDLQKTHRLVGEHGVQHVGRQRLSQYRFRHILFQKYVYDSLGQAKRMHLHEAVGAALEELYGDQVDEMAVELAYHFREAGNVGKAIGYLGRAAHRAAGVSANEEAIIHFTQALALLETLPETPERNGHELMLQVGLIVALQSTKGYGDPEAGRACAWARELCGRVGETPQLFLVMWLLALFYGTRGDHRTARELTQQNHGLAERIGDPGLVNASHSMVGWNRLLMGDLSQAREHLEQAMVFYELQQHRSLAVLFGAEPTLAALSTGPWDLWILGYPDQALECSRKALALAGEMAHLPNLAMTQGFAGLFHVFRRDVQMAQEIGEACIDLCTGKGLAYWLEAGVFCRGWALAEQGQTEEGISLMRQGIAGYRMTGEIAHTQRLADLARICGLAGRTEDGLALLDDALETVQRNGEHFYEAEIHRLRGELLLLQGADEAQAEGCFRRAIELARQQSARMWELRATVSLCRLWQRQGKCGKARKQLAQIYDWFSEGFDTPDLQEAQALLEKLA